MKKKAVQLISIIGIVVFGSTGHAQSARKPARTETPRHQQSVSRTYKGCLQRDWGGGFLLLTPTGSAESRNAQMMTYRVVSGRNVDVGAMANKMVEITGTLSTAKSSTGNTQTVPGSVREVGGAGGKADSTYVNGTLTASSIRETAGSCQHDASKP